MNLNRLLARWSWPLALVMLWLAACIGSVGGATIKPAIIPSVHTTLTPTSAIQAPLRLSAAQTSVWRYDQEQRMLLSGGVSVSLG